MIERRRDFDGSDIQTSLGRLFTDRTSLLTVFNIVQQMNVEEIFLVKKMNRNDCSF
jgi:hypothetical protein